MNRSLDQEMDSFDPSGKGLEGPPPAGDVDERAKGGGKGFRDKKKVLLLVALAVAAAGVIGYQFLGGTGPKVAVGVSTTPKAAANHLSAADVDSVLERIETAQRPGSEDEVSVARVEELVKKFDTYVQERQIPVTAIQTNPFEVLLPKTAEQQAKQDDSAKLAAEAEARERKARIHTAAAKIKVGSVMLVGQKRLAIIDGKLRRVGDKAGEFLVESIDAQRVVLSCEGETVELPLHPKTGT